MQRRGFAPPFQDILLTTADSAPTAWADLFRQGRGVYTIALALGILLHAMDAFLLGTVMPTVVREIGGAAYYSWGVMLYMTASIIGAASGGPIKIRLGSRRGYAAAGVIMLGGTLVAAAADSIGMLLLGRFIQGFGAGLIVSQNVALIQELFPVSLRPRMIAITSFMWATSAFVGPLIGGIFAEFGWWRGAFLFAVPLIVFFTGVAWLKLPERPPTPEQRARRFPIGRVALLGLGVLTVGGTSNVDQAFDALGVAIGASATTDGLHGLGPKLVVLAIGLAIVWMTVRIDGRQTKSRVFPTAPFSLSGPVGTAYWAFMLVGMAPVAAGIFMPLVYQVVYHFPAIPSGYLSSILAVFWSLGSTITSGLSLPQQRLALVGGPVLAMFGVIGIGIGVGLWSWPYLVACTCLTGLGVGLCISHLMNWTMSLARKGEETVTASSIQTIRSLGIAFGAAGAGIIANQAGLGAGITAETVTNAVTSVQAVAAMAPFAAILLGALLVTHRRRHDESSADT
ncbi:MAG: MFS transporter [Alphaproteobacteria bacterium]|nr:MFS transporter [Alphaproteobacteria bacterium]